MTSLNFNLTLYTGRGTSFAVLAEGVDFAFNIVVQLGTRVLKSTSSQRSSAKFVLIYEFNLKVLSFVCFSFRIRVQAVNKIGCGPFR